MTPTIIKPTIGRVVWFRPSQTTVDPGFASHGNDQPYAAMIAHVHSDRLVNLSVFDANGTAHSRTSVELVQDGDAVPGCGYYCEWMPYQKSQAAKSDAADKGIVLKPKYRDPTQREKLEYALVSGAAAHLAQVPESATGIANAIKGVLDALHPEPVLFNPHTGMPRDARDVASDPQAILCVKPGDPLKAAAITLPVVDPGPDSLEREIQAKGANVAPRVTPDALKAEIVSEHYFTGADGVLGAYRAGGDVHPVGGTPSQATHQALGLLTFCVLVLRNDFTVVGHSACASPENFNAEIGRRIARENAEREIWPLLGFRLRDKLAAD